MLGSSQCHGCIQASHPMNLKDRWEVRLHPLVWLGRARWWGFRWGWGEETKLRLILNKWIQTGFQNQIDEWIRFRASAPLLITFTFSQSLVLSVLPPIKGLCTCCSLSQECFPSLCPGDFHLSFRLQLKCSLTFQSSWKPYILSFPTTILFSFPC